MTKKDYILIAKVFSTTAKIWIDTRGKWLKKMEAEGVPEDFSGVGGQYFKEKIDAINKILASLDVVVKGLCFELAKDNPRFDAVKFRAACGLEKVHINNNENDGVVAAVIEKLN